MLSATNGTMNGPEQLLEATVALLPCTAHLQVLREGVP